MSKRPPCPGDPRDYVWVKAKEGAHWRRKRGSVGGARLNAGYQASANATTVVSPAAASVRAALMPFLKGLDTGRLNIRIANAFRKSLKEKGSLELTYLKGVELQNAYPLEEMLHQYRVIVKEKTVQIEIPIDKTNVKALNRLVSNYFFEAVLLYGDVNKKGGLKVKSVESVLYGFGGKPETNCILELSLPKKQEWCLLLKLSSLEGNQLAAHTKHYRMKVVEAGKEK